MGRGVTCHHCGAGTPLPEDLRVPSFTCHYCGGALHTATYAGAAAVSADALIGHIGGVLREGTPAAVANAAAPRFQGGSVEARPARCQHCQAPVAVPLDLQIREFGCAACGRVQWVRQYISDGERFALDMQRQIAGNEAFKRLLETGVACTKCGGHNRVPEDGSVQFPCGFCRQPVLLADHVDPSAVARARLKHGVYALRDEAMAQQSARSRRERNIAVAAVLVLALLILAAALLFTPR